MPTLSFLYSVVDVELEKDAKFFTVRQYSYGTSNSIVKPD